MRFRVIVRILFWFVKNRCIKSVFGASSPQSERHASELNLAAVDCRITLWANQVAHVHVCVASATNANQQMDCCCCCFFAAFGQTIETPSHHSNSYRSTAASSSAHRQMYRSEEHWQWQRGDTSVESGPENSAEATVHCVSFGYYTRRASISFVRSLIHLQSCVFAYRAGRADTSSVYGRIRELRSK